MDLYARFEDACADGEVAEVRHLLDEGSLTVDDATRCLSYARQQPLVLRCLLEYGADARSVQPRGLQSFETLKTLAEFGFDVRTHGHLILQDFADDQIALDWLLDHGVDINETDSRRLNDGFFLANGTWDHSLHVLNLVAAAGNVALFDHLVSRGANPSKSLALHAVSRNHDPAKSLPMLSYLLDKQHMGINAGTDALRFLFRDAMDAGTPLCTAIYHKNLAIVQELVDRGADVDTGGNSGYRPISKAIGESRSLQAEGFLPAVKILIQGGVDGNRALSRAIYVLRVEAAEVCLQCGADPTSALQETREQHVSIMTGSTTVPDCSQITEGVVQRSQDMISLLESWSSARCS